MGAERACPYCGSSIAYEADRCPYCDSVIDENAGIPAYVRDVQGKREGDGQEAAKESAAYGAPVIARGMDAVLAARKARRERKDPQTENGFAFSEAEALDGLTVCGFTGAYPAELVIPQRHNGRPVVAIGREAFKGLPVSRVVIPPSVQAIGEAAFEHCVSLYEVREGIGLRTIGENAFRGCCLLDRFPALLSGGIHAGRSSFAGCYALGLSAESACALT